MKDSQHLVKNILAYYLFYHIIQIHLLFILESLSLFYYLILEIKLKIASHDIELISTLNFFVAGNVVGAQDLPTHTCHRFHSPLPLVCPLAQ